MGKVAILARITNDGDSANAEAGHLAMEDVRTEEVSGIVDTGAAMLVLPEAVAKRLGFPKNGETRVRYADHRTATRDIVGRVHLEYAGRSAVFTAVVEPSRTEALIGAIVLETLDLLVDCKKQVLVPRDPEMIMTEIE